jgi:hypothetical protein
MAYSDAAPRIGLARLGVARIGSGPTSPGSRSSFPSPLDGPLLVAGCVVILCLPLLVVGRFVASLRTGVSPPCLVKDEVMSSRPCLLPARRRRLGSASFETTRSRPCCGSLRAPDGVCRSGLSRPKKRVRAATGRGGRDPVATRYVRPVRRRRRRRRPKLSRPSSFQSDAVDVQGSRGDERTHARTCGLVVDELCAPPAARATDTGRRVGPMALGPNFVSLISFISSYHEISRVRYGTPPTRHHKVIAVDSRPS